MDAGELLVLFCYRVLQHCHQHDNLCAMQTRAVAQRAEEVSPSLPPTPVISFLRPFTCTYMLWALLLISALYSTDICLVSMPYTMSLSCSLRLLNHTHIPTHPHANTHKRTFTRTYVHTHMYVHMHTTLLRPPVSFP